MGCSSRPELPECWSQARAEIIGAPHLDLHFFVCCVCLRWFGTDLEVGFVIYVKNGPRGVFGMSPGVRMCTHYDLSQIPRSPERGAATALPAAAHAPLHRPVGGGEVACE